MNDGTRGPIFILKRKDSSSSVPASLTSSSSNKRASNGKLHKASSSKRASHLNPLSVPLASNEAIATLSYVADKDDEFNVEVGDRFIILKKTPNWFLVRRKGDPVVKGVQGWVPSGCLRIGTSGNEKANDKEPSTPTSSTGTGSPVRGTVLYDYKAGTSSELSVKKGESILIYRKADHWLYAENMEQIKGWVPETYVSVKKSSFSEGATDLDVSLVSRYGEYSCWLRKGFLLILQKKSGKSQGDAFDDRVSSAFIICPFLIRTRPADFQLLIAYTESRWQLFTEQAFSIDGRYQLHVLDSKYYQHPHQSAAIRSIKTI
jgi:hypothetical protein